MSRTIKCPNCNTEEKVNQAEIDKENEQRGNDLTMENGEPARPDKERHWSEKEKEVLTEMLMKVASPDADWKSANELTSLAVTESLDLWETSKTLTSSPLPARSRRGPSRPSCTGATRRSLPAIVMG